MNTGWISLHRKLQDNPLWLDKPFTRGQAWVDLLLLANRDPGYIHVRDHKIDLEKGDVDGAKINYPKDGVGHARKSENS